MSVEKSELLSTLLQKLNVPHEVLNAKNHAREAEIVKHAGEKGHVTIATNMAGRGTDIVLGEGVKEIGGLFVIGTERHESRRIDNQLRGRSGRQGDPGRSRFFLSLEDDLMRIFASDRLSGIMQRLGMEEGEAIVSPMVSRAIERAQKRVEEQNFSSRKHLLEYDDVMNQQRQVIYTRRKAALMGQSEIDFVEPTITNVVQTISEKYSPEALNAEAWDFSGIEKEIKGEFNIDLSLSNLDASDTTADAIAQEANEKITAEYRKKAEDVGPENMIKIECYVYLQIIDQAWKDHLLAMDALKDAVSLRGYGQRDPLQEYKKEAFTLFSQLMGRIEEETTLALLRMPKPEVVREMPYEEVDMEELEFKHPDASSAPAPQPPAPATPDNDKLVYHGSRQSPPQEEKAAQQTYKRETAKIGRNDPCPCGSGKKYKKCHGLPGAQPLPQEAQHSL